MFGQFGNLNSGAGYGMSSNRLNLTPKNHATPQGALDANQITAQKNEYHQELQSSISQATQFATTQLNTQRDHIETDRAKQVEMAQKQVDTGYNAQKTSAEQAHKQQEMQRSQQESQEKMRINQQAQAMTNALQQRQMQATNHGQQLDITADTNRITTDKNEAIHRLETAAGNAKTTSDQNLQNQLGRLQQEKDRQSKMIGQQLNAAASQRTTALEQQLSQYLLLTTQQESQNK